MRDGSCQSQAGTGDIAIDLGFDGTIILGRVVP